MVLSIFLAIIGIMTDQQFRKLLIYLRVIIAILAVITGTLGIMLWAYVALPS